MPYGRIREKPENRKRADVIIVSKTPANISQSAMNAITTELEPYEHQKVYFSSVKYRDLTPVFPDHAREKLKLRQPFGSNSGAVLITGIASPGLLKTFLQGFFQEIIHLDFPDHHYFRENDIEKIRRALKKLKSTRRLLITTEKDAVRLREFPELEDPEKRNLYFVPMEISFIKDENHEFDNLIIGYVRENKRDNWVS
jgi:tetraacyldisaccharide 4'-kinase